MVISDIGIVILNNIVIKEEFYYFEVYDVITGLYINKVKVEESVYNTEKLNMSDKKSIYVFHWGELIDIPIMQDFLETANEVRQMIVKILPGEVAIPEALVGIVTPTIVSYVMAEGPVDG